MKPGDIIIAHHDIEWSPYHGVAVVVKNDNDGWLRVKYICASNPQIAFGSSKYHPEYDLFTQEGHAKLLGHIDD